MLQTERLQLRHWQETDADALYTYAKDPEVGPAAGWRPHENVEESRKIIRSILSGAECYAICEKDGDGPIGAIELMTGTRLVGGPGECELGYWLARPFWGRGYMPEAAAELLRRAFEDLGMQTVWCAYYEGNQKSARVQAKLGFVPHHTKENEFVAAMGETRTSCVNVLTKERWEALRQTQR